MGRIAKRGHIDHTNAAIKAIDAELAARDAETLSKSFRAFIEAAWPIVVPGSPFIPGRHIDAIAEHMQALADRDIINLIVNVPPRSGKSTLISNMWPCWQWTRMPTERYLFGSYSLDLARDDSNRCRTIIKSEWFRARWPHIEIREDNDSKGLFENTLMGRRQITSTGGVTTGLGGSALVLDDPHNVLKAESASDRATTLRWTREAFSTRRNPGVMEPVFCVVMQRVHQQDVSGYFLEEGGWEHLCLPMEYEGSKKTTSIGWSDPRTEVGENLWPERWDNPAGKRALAGLKKTLGATGVAGQLQQRPVPRGGGTFKREWLRFWYDGDRPPPEPVVYTKDDGTPAEHPQRPLPELEALSTVQSWDLAFKGLKSSDYVVGQAWCPGKGKDDAASRYLLAQERGQWDFVATKGAFRRLAADKPATTTLVEEKANGAAIIAELKTEITGLIAINPKDSKYARASAVAPLFEAGNVWLPHPKQHPWVEALLDELLLFPRGSYDDQVDALTQALLRMQEKHVEAIAAESVLMRLLTRVSPWMGV